MESFVELWSKAQEDKCTDFVYIHETGCIKPSITDLLNISMELPIA